MATQIAARILREFDKPRFGIIHGDGSFEDLTGRNYGDHPHAANARWYGGARDRNLLFAAFMAYFGEKLDVRR